MIRNAIFLTLVAFALTFTPASAALVDLSQHGYGPGLIYDSNSQLVWLQDANYALTSGYDADEDGTAELNGLMTWSQAGTWANNLDAFGHSDWRLPRFASSTDFRIAESEFTGLSTQLADPANIALFNNLMTNLAYWSETPLLGMARGYHFGSDQPALLRIDTKAYAWAVRDGSDITLTHTPVPASLWLMASGIFCLLGYRRKRS